MLLEDSRKDETMPHTGSFSITAPRFTAAEETEERLALSSEEREKVVKDLFGGDPNTLPEEEKHLSELISLVREAIDNINEAEKQEYLRALQICPHLVEKESGPVRFLRCDHYHAEVRRNLFSFKRNHNQLFFRTHAVGSLSLSVSLSFVIHRPLFPHFTLESCKTNR